MKKEDLIAAMAEDMGVPKTKAKTAFENLFNRIAGSLGSGNDVKIPDFGKFRYKETKERNGRNPQTGEAIKIPAGKAVKFSPSKTLRELVSA